MAVAKSLNDASSSTSAKENSDEQVINYIIISLIVFIIS